MSEKPLKGVKVLDLTYFIAGPGAGRILADWGADVIKVEPAFGDPCRSLGKTYGMPCIDREINLLYSTYNANKRGLSLNLKDPAGLAILDRLLQSAKVFLTSYRTAALTRMGLDYESLSARFPHLIWAQVNGFGDHGPAKDNPGFDSVSFWARAGGYIDLPERDTSPLNHPSGFGDSTTACSLTAGICAALYRQAMTGQGTKVMVSLFGQAIWCASSSYASTQFGDKYPKTRKEASMPTLNSYKCKDGEWLFLSILEHEKFFPLLCKVLKREDLLTDKFTKTENAKAHTTELIEILEKEFLKYDRDELVEMLSSVDIAQEKIRHFADVLSDPQALENNYLCDFKNRNGQITKMAMPPAKFGDIERDPIQDAPLIGQDSREILAEAGFTQEEIEGFLAGGIVHVEN